MAFTLEPFEVNGKRIEVAIVETSLKNSYARVVEGRLIIKLPRRLKEREKIETANNLYTRMKRALQKNPHRFISPKRMEFQDGQTLTVLGKPIRVEIRPSGRSRVIDGTLIIKSKPDTSKERISSLAKRAILKWSMKEVEDRVKVVNSIHFRSDLGRISLRENSTNWGSCTTRTNNISLNFKLLFLPDKALDYVIVHELAHTKVRAHSDRFWSLVESAMPDYRQWRKWLRENGNMVRDGPEAFKSEGNNY
jgi:predicted metal-dependent hydrolase